MYDEFGDNRVQLKVGPCIGVHYKVGDTIGISDGLYIGYEGVVVIKDHIFVSEFGTDEVFTKWGDSFPVDILELNPVQAAILDAEKKHALKEPLGYA